MKILHVCQDFPGQGRPHQGIFVKRSLEAVGALKGHHFSPEVLSPVAYVLPFRWFPYHELAQVPSSETVNCPALPSLCEYTVHHPRYLYPAPKRFFYHLAGRWLRKALVRYSHQQLTPPDIIHAHYPYPEGYASIALAKHWGVPLIVHERGTIMRQVFDAYPRVRPLILDALKAAACIITASEDLRERCLKAGIEGSKVRCLSDGVDLQRFRPMDRQQARTALGLEPTGAILLFVGNIVPEKGIMEIVEAAETLITKLPKCTFVLIGGGTPKFTAHVQRAIEMKGLTGYFRLVGRRPPEEVPLWMNAADLFLLPSWSEGRPGVIFEALATGTSIVASRVGGIPELIDHQRTGMLIEPRDINGLIEAVVTLMADEDRRSEMGQRGREAVKKLGLTWEAHAERLATVYQSLAELTVT